MGVHFDLRPDDHLTQVERAGLRGVHDRQTVGSALVAFGDIYAPTRDRERVATQADAHDRRPDLAFRTTRTQRRFWFFTQLHARQQTRQARRHVQLYAAQWLVPVFAAHRQRERRERSSLNVRRASSQFRSERQRVRTRGPVGTSRDFKARGRIGRRVPRPRTDRRRSRIRPTQRRRIQRRPRSTKEFQMQIFER